MTKDPVCGMQVDETKAAATTQYHGVALYFCCVSCKEKFIKEPQKYPAGDAKPAASCCK